MAEPRALATAALYLVLKSNGLHCPKIRLKKFGFSLTTTSANIAKKLPPQRCSKPFFNFSHKRPTFALTPESGYTLAFRRKMAHSGSHAETGGRFGRGWYHYSRSVPHVHQHPRAGYQNGKLCRFWVLPETLLKNAESLRNSDALMRVDVPKASRPRWAA